REKKNHQKMTWDSDSIPYILASEIRVTRRSKATHTIIQ
ncbi:MAG: hypothetical protein ACI90V_014343, partial [Bacillariaceae sp.]